MRHVITNAVGGNEPGIKVEVHKVSLQPGDVALFCSDGLNSMLRDEEIAAVLTAEREPEAACAKLIAAANHTGGGDNITVIVARFDAVAPPERAGSA